jgi:hypothetical protein
MSKWLIFGTDKTEDGAMEGFQRLNAARSREKLFKANSIIFVDDNGLTHADVYNLTDARNAGLPGKGSAGAAPQLDFPSSFCGCQAACCGPPKCADGMLVNSDSPAALTSTVCLLTLAGGDSVSRPFF